PKPQPKPAQEAKKPNVPPAPQVKKEQPKPAQQQPTPTTPVVPPANDQLISAKAESLKGLTVLGKIELPADRPKKTGGPVASSDERGRDKKRPRKRIDKPGGPGQGNRPPGAPGARPHPAGGRPGGNPRTGPPVRAQKAEPTQKEIQDQIKQTLARLQG